MTLDFGNVIPARRLPVYLLIDTSDSMLGEPLNLARQVVTSLHHELMNMPEVIDIVALSAILFGGKAWQAVPLTEVAEFVLPDLDVTGASTLGAAFRVLGDALDREMRPNRPGMKGDYRALILLLAGSMPIDDWQGELKALPLNRYIGDFVALSCNEDVELDYLEQITTAVFAAKAFSPKQATREFIRFASLPLVRRSSATMPTAIERSQMREVSASMTIEPFGKVNYWDLPSGEGRMVRATILTEFHTEGAEFGLALDCSGSMQNLFKPVNHVKPAMQAVAGYLADKDRNGTVSVIYWATGPEGKDVQIIGDLTRDVAETYDFGPPERYGRGTQLLPALRYFTDSEQRTDLDDASWGFYVFVTDGKIEDIEAVKEYTTQLAKELEPTTRPDSGKRLKNIKLILIGLGDRIDKAQFDALDDLETGTELDLWDTKLAGEMKDLAEIFAEVTDPDHVLVPGGGIVRDSRGNVVADFRDRGLPEVLEFVLPFGEPAFELEIAGNSAIQPLPFAARGFGPSSFLSIEPSEIDFGTVESLAQISPQPIYIRNTGIGVWQGSAEANAAWLSVKPNQLECPPVSTTEVRVSLKPGAESHLGTRVETGTVTISGTGYAQAIQVSVSLALRFHVFSTAEERVISAWEFVHEDFEGSAPKLFQERTYTLTRVFCDWMGLASPSEPKWFGEFCRFVLDVSTVFVDTGVATKLPFVCSVKPTLSDNDLVMLDALAGELDLPGRLIVLFLSFGAQQAVQAARRLVIESRFNRWYDIVPLGYAELRNLVYAPNPHQALRTLVLSNVNLEAVSPFQPLGPANDNTFSGREFELGTIVGNVREKSYAIVGGRRIGKTSLLRRLHRKNLPQSGFRVLFHDCGLSAYQDFLELTPRYWAPEMPVEAPRTFRELFDSPHTNKPLVLLLDEVDGLISGDALAGWPLFKAMRGLVNSKRMQIVISGANNLRQALKDSGSPLFNLTQHTLRLERLDYPATKDLVTRPMSALLIRLVHEEAIVNLVWEYTGGHPCVVQRLCSRLIRRINTDLEVDTTMAQRQITPDDVRAVVRDPTFLSEDFLDIYLEQTTYLERIIALILVQSEERFFQVQDVQSLLKKHTQCNVKVRDIKAALERLVELRCILARSYQGYSFDTKAFPRALQQPNVVTIEDLLVEYTEGFLEYGDVPPRSRYEEVEYG